MASIEYAVEIGTWVESDTPKVHQPPNATTKVMRKVWVAGDAGEDTRIAVIARADGKADRHLVTLPVGNTDARDIAGHVLTLALQGVQAYGAQVSKPAPAKTPAPKAPTPPAAPVAKARAALGKPAPAPRVSAPAPAAPASTYSATDWASLIG